MTAIDAMIVINDALKILKVTAIDAIIVINDTLKMMTMTAIDALKMMKIMIALTIVITNAGSVGRIRDARSRAVHPVEG